MIQNLRESLDVRTTVNKRYSHRMSNIISKNTLPEEQTNQKSTEVPIEERIDEIIIKLRSERPQTRRRNRKDVDLAEADIYAIAEKCRSIFMSQPMLLELAPPIKICGDIHGQYDDLLRMFELGGFPPDSNYLFLGDYVDRGHYSLETILILFCYKIKYPDNFFLLRGNHECKSISMMYGFYDECKRRYNVKMWKKFISTFDCLPVAAVIEKKILLFAKKANRPC